MSWVVSIFSSQEWLDFKKLRWRFFKLRSSGECCKWRQPSRGLVVGADYDGRDVPTTFWLTFRKEFSTRSGSTKKRRKINLRFGEILGTISFLSIFISSWDYFASWDFSALAQGWFSKKSLFSILVSPWVFGMDTEILIVQNWESLSDDFFCQAQIFCELRFSDWSAP